MRRRLLIAALLLMAVLLTGCGGAKNPYADIENNPIATITLTDGSKMVFELYPQIAPNTVANFVKLANSGYYDPRTTSSGKTVRMEIFRVASNVLIQSGDPNNDGTGGPDYYIKGEFEANGFKNSLSHMRGTISMARKKNYDTAGSQFFIMQGSYPEYDGRYAAFGRIMDEESLATLDAIGSRPVDGSNRPIDRVYIQSIRVETFDVEYEPVTLSRESVDGKEDNSK